MMPMMNMMPMQCPQAPPTSSSVPTFAPLAMPTPVVPMVTQEKVPNELLTYLQKRSADLPPDVQQKVQTESRKQGKKAIKDLQAAAKSLGEARTAYEESLLARSQHISSWQRR